MGVWIETQFYQKETENSGVTPFVGVWIETIDHEPRQHKSYVTPFVGVWIETIAGGYQSFGNTSHTLRGCVD